MVVQGVYQLKGKGKSEAQTLFVPREVFKHNSVFKFHDWKLIYEQK